jgi:hypothetical protein
VQQYRRNRQTGKLVAVGAVSLLAGIGLAGFPDGGDLDTQLGISGGMHDPDHGNPLSGGRGPVNVKSGTAFEEFDLEVPVGGYAGGVVLRAGGGGGRRSGFLGHSIVLATAIRPVSADPITRARTAAAALPGLSAGPGGGGGGTSPIGSPTNTTVPATTSTTAPDTTPTTAPDTTSTTEPETTTTTEPVTTTTEPETTTTTERPTTTTTEATTTTTEPLETTTTTSETAETSEG